MESSASSALLAESLAALSKTTHQLIADTEARSRAEVARIVAESKEAFILRDKALKDLHAAQLEAQAWKQEANSSKAALGQAELTIAHQTDMSNQQVETIAQLRREVNQWKDQSRNWQEHFLRVEQERCALSSRLDELVVESLQWVRNATASTSTSNSTPRSRYLDAMNSSNPSASKRSSVPSPTLPPSYKSAPLGSEDEVCANTPKGQGAAKSRKALGQPAEGTKSRVPPQHELPPYSVAASSSASTSVHASRSTQGSARKKVAAAPHADSPSEGQSANQKPSIRQSTVIRRVQAIVNVKREESDEEVVASPSKVQVKASEEAVDLKQARRRSRMIVEDEEDEAHTPETGDRRPSRKVRTAKTINYNEACSEDESEEDELMLGNEDDETFGISKPLNQPRTKQPPTNGPPATKRRKVTSKIT